MVETAGPEPKAPEGEDKAGECFGRSGKEKNKMIKKNYEELERLDLQLFAEEGNLDEGIKNDEGENPYKEDKPDEDGKKNKESDKRTYDDAEVDRIVAKHKAEWEKQHKKDLEAAKDEARKYERMSKEQREEADKKKAEEEAAKKDARIKELEQQIATDALRKSVAADVEAMPEGINASQDFLDLVVTGDADVANSNVKKLVGIILADRKAQEAKRATGRTPGSYSGSGDGDISEIERRIAKYK